MKLIIGLLLGLLIIGKTVYSINSNIKVENLEIIELSENLEFGSSFDLKLKVSTSDKVPLVVNISIKGVLVEKELIIYSPNSTISLVLPIYVPDEGLPEGYYSLKVWQGDYVLQRSVYISRALKSFPSSFKVNTESNESDLNITIHNKGYSSLFEIWLDSDESQRRYVSQDSSLEINYENKDYSEFNVKNLLDGSGFRQEFQSSEEILEPEISKLKLVYSSPTSKASEMGIYLFCFVLILLIVIQTFI
jgi:hypothetical protein